ncbi:hypothetical protein WICMUC_003155 [Wickerhamomyces mucosus]|uniref:Uncharacterized protein n=1 Tax=Wickerhamomyces mucosus TaxID=1378264 RepID=A0A9P8PNU3_9ASCO|nr:hypothetical protein WICMUC_003155 [Wickerhamomyces mucosus]
MTERIQKNERIEGKIIKHNPSKQYKYSTTEYTINIQSKTPYVSALKRASKMLKLLPKKQPKKDYIIINGMGKAISKTLSIALHFQYVEGNKVEILTKTVEVLDEFDDGNEDNDTVLRKRKISAVEIHIFKSAYD